jgi:hypothetical protein
MVTVKDAFDAYCKERNLPPPTGKDYKNAGRLINTHFRRFWGVKQTPEIVSSAHYLLDKERGIIVFSYPDIFLIEMIGRIDFFLSQKSQRKDSVPKPKSQATPQKKERKRIPLKQKPAYEPKNRRNDAF